MIVEIYTVSGDKYLIKNSCKPPQQNQAGTLAKIGCADAPVQDKIC